jgi:hypothetical protein
MNAPSVHAYGVRAVHDNVVYLGRIQPARRTDSELARAIDAHVEQIRREQEGQYAAEWRMARFCAWSAVAVALFATALSLAGRG